MRYKKSPGFTLLELLISATLISVVLGVGLEGLDQARKSADLATSRTLAQETAKDGTRQLVELLRRADIIYYTARPLLNNDTATLVAAADPTPPTIPAPNLTPAFPDLVNIYGGVPNTIGKAMVPDPRGQETVVYSGNTNLPVDRRIFRVGSPVVQAGMVGTGNGGALKCAGGAVPPGGTLGFDDTFTSPLCYMAEAIYDTQDIAGGINFMKNVPIGWNFYIIYLAPMAEPPDDNAQYPRTNGDVGTRDLGPPLVAGGAPWLRSTLPLELRLVTIRNVSAAIGIQPISGGANPAAYSRNYDDKSVLPVPYDFKTTSLNYDPIALAMTTDAAQTLNPAAAAYEQFANVHGGTVDTNSGNRVQPDAGGDAVHGNYIGLGNDPPTAAVFSKAINSPWVTVGDTVIASYIDPDSVNGTFIRLENAGSIVDPISGLTHRLVNAYEAGVGTGCQGEFLYNPKAGPPTRGVVSISTRYRASSGIPFQFGTVSEEVSLDRVASYQNYTTARLSR